MSHRLSVSFATTLSIATVMTTEAPDTWTANDAAIRLFDRCVDHHADRQGERVHATRYKLSFRFLHKHDPRILQPGALAVLVLGGGRGVFESCLQRVQNVTLRGYDGDLSYPYCSLANHSADLILSMEGAHGRVFHLYPCQRLLLDSRAADSLPVLAVIEHLKDQAVRGISAHWQGSGVFNHLREMARLLRTGGRALITTPNVASYDAMARLLQGRGPFMFPPHVRELSLRELAYLMEQAGLTVHRATTVDVYPHARSARAPFEEVARHAHKHRDHNDTIVALVGATLPSPDAAASARPLTDRLLPHWRKRISIKLPGDDTLVHTGCA